MFAVAISAGVFALAVAWRGYAVADAFGRPPTFVGAISSVQGAGALAGGLLAFALSFDEVIVTTFTAGQQTTLPIWMFQELIRPRQRPVTNVVAVIMIALTFIPIIAAYWLTRSDEDSHSR